MFGALAALLHLALLGAIDARLGVGGERPATAAGVLSVRTIPAGAAPPAPPAAGVGAPALPGAVAAPVAAAETARLPSRGRSSKASTRSPAEPEVLSIAR